MPEFEVNPAYTAIADQPKAQTYWYIHK